MTNTETPTLSEKVEIKYNIYNSEDELVATIHDNSIGSNIDMSLEVFTDNTKKLPFLLQIKDISSEGLQKFLKGRVLPNRPSVEEELQSIGLEYNWKEMIKLNSGRVLTDEFYILTTSENEIETVKSTKTCIIESTETLQEELSEPEIIENLQNEILSDNFENE